MKIRTDFVSNSSSSSFILSGQNGSVLLMAQKVAEIFEGKRLFIDYEFASSIRINIKCKNKWFKEIQEYINLIDGESSDSTEYSEYYEDWATGKKVKKDPEEISWDSIPISVDILSELNSNPEIIKKIDHMYFTTQDENMSSQNVWLKLLYDFFEALDCNPDKSDSERSFEEEPDSVVSKMKEIILSRKVRQT